MRDIEQIFSAALEREAPEARAAYLDQACDGDDALRRQVERLLAVDPLVSSFLEAPAVPPTLPFEVRPAEEPGTSIGPYRLLEPIGEGGMGTVYMAEQAVPVRRRVALKVIKPGMDSRQVVARFEAERQALALMDHPGIARVLDGGMTPEGRPYFVMELVRGLPITDYCDREELTIPERLELFVLVCRAVQHAHQKGVIHRDIKPSNVLVTVIDGVAVPKVIDFGVAKAIGEPLTEKTLFTAFHQLVGTPLYMSPEQAELAGADVDTRSDIYSLGVLLYELLTGTTPFDSETLKKAAFDEMRRILREQEPPKPSTRLSSLGEQLSTVSARRRADPRRLGSSLRGELDWVVMKALEKDRRRRYESASDLAADVMNYLTDRPVEACPPGARYRAAKYARRHRWALTTAALVATALVVGTAVSIWQAVRATRAEARSEQHRRRAERSLYAFSLRQVQEMIEQGQVERAQQRLDELREELGERATSDFAWRYLNRLASREVEIFAPHRARAVDIKISPDGRLLASSDDQGAILLTELDSGRVRRRLEARSTHVSSLAFSPDGRRLLAHSLRPAATNEHAVEIWDLGSGRLVGQIGPFEAGWVGAPVFSSTGRRIALLWNETGKGPNLVRLYDVEARPARPILVDELRFQPGHPIVLDPATVASLPLEGPFTVYDTETLEPRWVMPGEDQGYGWPRLSEDGRRIGTDHETRGVAIRDARTGRLCGRLPTGKGPNQIVGYTLSNDGRSLVIRTDPLRIAIVDFRDARAMPPRELALENADQYSRAEVYYSPDNSKIAIMLITTNDEPGSITLWDASSATCLRTYPGQMQNLTRLTPMLFSPDGASLFLNGEDGVRRWWFSRGHDRPPERLAGHRDEAWSLAFSPDGRILASGSDDTETGDTLRLWDPATGRLLIDWRADPGAVSTLAFSPDGQTLATGTLADTQNLRLWEARTGRLLATLSGHTDRIRSVAFSPDGRTLASAGSDRTIRLWDAASGRALPTLNGHAETVRKVVFSPDGRILASASNDCTVRLWDPATARETRTLRGSQKYASVVFTPDGSTLAAADEGGDITLWDVATGERVRVLRGEPDRLLALACARDGTTLAAAGLSRTIHVWDLPTGQELLSLRGHASQINGLEFSPDGKLLASCSHDGEVRLWRSEPWSSDLLERPTRP